MAGLQGLSLGVPHERNVGCGVGAGVGAIDGAGVGASVGYGVGNIVGIGVAVLAAKVPIWHTEQCQGRSASMASPSRQGEQPVLLNSVGTG
jgi:hypothetical protein